MKNVAAGLIEQFGGTGKLIVNDDPPDPITGIGGGNGTEIEVKYFRELYEDNELVENRIINGDARLIITMDQEPKTDWSFSDSEGILWNILAIAPIEAQEMNVVYQFHIRK